MIERASVLRLLRSVAVGLAFLSFGVGVLVLRTALLGRAAFEAAEQAFDRGELRESVRQARRAASLVVPGAPYVDAAYLRMMVIARGAEAVGRPHLAAFSWSSIRSAAIESRTPLLGERPELEQANRNLARLATQLGAEPDAPASAAAERELRETLQRVPPPGMSALVFLGFGLLSLVLGMSWVAVRGLTREGGLVPRHLLLGLGLVVIGAACWTWAVYQA
jgi:hypothetical protein